MLPLCICPVPIPKSSISQKCLHVSILSTFFVSPLLSSVALTDAAVSPINSINSFPDLNQGCHHIFFWAFLEPQTLSELSLFTFSLQSHGKWTCSRKLPLVMVIAEEQNTFPGLEQMQRKKAKPARKPGPLADTSLQSCSDLLQPAAGFFNLLQRQN